MNKNIRNNGLNQDCTPTGIPKAKLATEDRTSISSDVDCPNCGCLQVMEIEVPVENRMLSGGSGIGYYIGCPACPWASPMIAVATSQGAAKEGMEA